MKSDFKKFVLIFVALMSFHLLGIAQEATDKSVTLVVSGDGMTKDAATKQALRSAIEQAFGTFVSANTDILNDELIRDEIVTVSSGNVSNYKEINCLQNKDGSYNVTLEATVSIGKLTSFAKSKGVTAELATGAFAMNMKIRELNKQNELQAIKDLQKKLSLMDKSYNFFDYKLILGEPYLNGENYAINVRVDIKPNQNLANFRNAIISTLQSLSLTETEKDEYERANIPFKRIKIKVYKSDEEFLSNIQSGNFDRAKVETIYLRNTDEDYPNLIFPWMMLNNELGFAIKDNIGSLVGIYFTFNENYPEFGKLLAEQHLSLWAFTNFKDKYRKSKTQNARYGIRGIIANDENLIFEKAPRHFICFSMDENFNVYERGSNDDKNTLNGLPAGFSFEISYPKNLFTTVNNIELVHIKPHFL